MIQLRALFEMHPPLGGKCTLYFGGGTPGLFPAERFAPIISEVQKFFEIEECSIETNPALTTRKRFSELRAVGFDRVTIGAQSLCSNVLQVFGRKHVPQDGLNSIAWAREAGFEQVQADLIYGLRAGERSSVVEDEVAEFVRAGATGISAYALSLERRTRIYSTNLANEDVAVQEYSAISRKCLELGLHRNETSNFSFAEAKHNNVYWYGWPYLGVGTAAHGLLPSSTHHPLGRRYSVGRFRDEISPGNDFLPFHYDASSLFEMNWEEPRSFENYFSEMVFTLLRTPRGIPFLWLQEWACEKIWELWKADAKVQRAVEQCRMSLDENNLALQGDEFLLGDAWALHLISIADPVSFYRSKHVHCFP